MSFTALNLSAEGVELDAEEHTRELQVEQAFKSFQAALKLQKDGQFDKANDEYNELFKINVITDDSNVLSPVVRTLRYLAFRNRGLLHIDEIKSKGLTGEIKTLFELLLFAIDDLVTCLHYSDGDLSVVSLLLGIFQLFQNDRLSRFLIEYELTKDDDDAINQRKRELSYEFLIFLNEQNKLLRKLGIEDKTDSLPELVQSDLSFLSPVVDYVDTRAEIFNNEESKTIKLDTISWESLTFSLADTIKSKGKLSKNRDCYSLLEEPITKLKFSVPQKKIVEAAIEPQATETVKRSIEDDAPQRSSKRVRQQSDADVGAINVEDSKSQMFLDKLNSFLTKLNRSEISVSECSSDFNRIILNWLPRYSDSLLQSSSDSSMEISHLFTSNVLDDKKGPGLSTDDSSSLISDGQLHFIDVRRKVVQSLLTKNKDGKILVIDYQFDHAFYKVVENLVLSAEDHIFNEAKLSSGSNHSLHVGIFEILVNKFLRLIAHQKTNDNKLISDSIFSIRLLLLKWHKLIGKSKMYDTDLRLRYSWASLFMLNYISKSGNLEERFLGFLEKVEANNSSIDIGFWNYDYIPSLNIETIKSQSSRLNIISNLEKTLELVTGDLNETALLLEKLLLAEDLDLLSAQEQLMISFIQQNSISLRFRLWRFLLDHYISTKDVKSYNNALVKTLPLLLDVLSDYENHTDSEREQLLLTTLAHYGHFISGFTTILKDANWKLDTKNGELLSLVATFFEFLHPIFAFDEVKNSTHEQFFKRMIIDTICVICIVFKNMTDVPNDLLELYLFLHDEVGALKFCDFNNGLLLDLSQHLLEGIDPNIATDAIHLQHLNCKFHLFISSESYVPIDHGTKEAEFDRTLAIQYSDYILESILSKNALYKPDVKNSLDILFESIGAPDLSNPSLQVNTSLFEQFMNSDLKLNTFRQAISGTFELNLKPVNSPESKSIRNGLYFLYGLINLNIYKIRKKSAQSKVLDLELIIRLFKYDLVYGTYRPESWAYLAQSYSLQAEDDLTWTSDKLNTPEKKAATADSQRKSILCSLISLSLVINNPEAADNVTKILLLSNLGYELYHGISKPMDGVLLTRTPDTLLENEKGIYKVEYKLTPERSRFLLKFIYKIFSFAISLKNDDWLLHLYKAKTMRKLSFSPPAVLKSCLKSCELNPNAIEPNYLLCSMIYKFFREGLLTEKDGIETLQKNQLFKDLELAEAGPTEFYTWILSALRKLVIIDKKKWHHLPKARLSKIYHDLAEYRLAFQEIDSLVILKSTNKNLIHIWKPEYEAPGKHFVYVHNYAKFYINLTNKLADIHSLILFTKKLRRVGTSLVDLQSVWDIACTDVCLLTKDIVGSRTGYTDIEVPKLVYGDFIKNSEKLNEIYQSSNPIDESEIPMLLLYLEIFDIRKMNNGFGSTSLIDDTFNTLYLKFYLEKLANNTFATDEQQVTQVPEPVQLAQSAQQSPHSPAKTKVARRDILAVAASFAKTIETKLKDNRMSDEKKFTVPQDIIEKHLSTKVTLYSVETPKPAGDVDASEDEFHTPNQSTAELD